jgi:hypothetical protein
MKANGFWYSVVCFFLFIFVNALCVSAKQKPCTMAEEKQALNEADQLKDWDALHRSFIRFSHCDDGAIAEGYSDTVGRLLAKDWRHISILVKLVASDKKFESFVLNHIDETIPTVTLTAITSHAQKSCPVGDTALCGKILQRIQAGTAP